MDKKREEELLRIIQINFILMYMSAFIEQLIQLNVSSVATGLLCDAVEIINNDVESAIINLEFKDIIKNFDNEDKNKKT